MILKVVFGCVRKLSMGCIQTGHTYFLPPHVCGSLWQGCRLVVHTCPLQLIGFLDLKYPSNYLFKPSFVGCRLICIIFIGSESIYTETFTQVCYKVVSGMYPNQTCGFSSPMGLWKFRERMPSFFTCCHQYIDWIQGSY